MRKVEGEAQIMLPSYTPQTKLVTLAAYQAHSNTVELPDIAGVYIMETQYWLESKNKEEINE